jgi:GT2 family glycosyltransferase
MRRISLILTHCPRVAAPVVRPVLRRDSQPNAAPWVSIVIPSSLRSRHVLRCLRRLLRGTAYPAFEILLAVSGIDPADRVQAARLQEAALLPRTRLLRLDLPVFNYAAVNNQAAAQATGEWLLLLNDDVVPITSDWLGRMVASVVAPDGTAADIVGARLLYGNGMVQHGGVIMGLANLCEHAFRLSARGDEGPQGLGQLQRQVSAVTAACMLVRRKLFESLGGFDEGFAIALNDVDFCLRLGQAGGRILFAGDIELYHFESLSLGRHYEGSRAALEAIEVARLRRRWPEMIAADPFYNPCASVEMGREFMPAFPPRQSPLSWIGQEARALH